MLRFYTFLIILVLCSLPVNAQISELPRQQRSSFEGRHFLVGFMQNELLMRDSKGEPLYLQSNFRIVIASAYTTTVRVRFPDETQERIYTVKRNEVLELYDLTKYEVTQQGKAVRGAIEILSDQPISVNAFSCKEQTSDAYAILPTESLGNEYYVFSTPNDYYWYADKPGAFDRKLRSSEFMVIASEDNTTLEFRPTSQTADGTPAGEIKVVELMKGDCYLVQSDTALYGIGQGNLLGSHIRSTKPVGVISGHVRSAAPTIKDYILTYGKISYPVESKDHLAEMLIPVQAWGRRYITQPLASQRGDRIMIIASQKNTIVNQDNGVTGSQILMSIPGDYRQREYVTEATLWESDKPFSLAQMMYSQAMATYDLQKNYYTEGLDPALTILPPLDQFINTLIVQIPALRYPEQTWKKWYEGHWINIVCDEAALEDLTINGRLFVDTIPVMQIQKLSTGAGNYYYAKYPASEEKYIIESKKGKFSGTIYGTNNADSYAMTIGFSLLDSAKKRDTLSPKLTVNEDCGRVRLTAREILSTSPSFIHNLSVIEDSTKNYKWVMESFGDTSAVLFAEPEDPLKDAELLVEVRDKAGNGKQYRYSYFAPGFKAPDTLSFVNVSSIGSKTLRMKFANPTTRNCEIQSVQCSDPRIKISSDKSFAYTLTPGEEIFVDVSFTPLDPLTKLDTDIIVILDCGIPRKITLNASIIKPGLLAGDMNYGDVRVGDTACRDIVIRNTDSLAIQVHSVPGLQGVGEYWTEQAFPLTLFPKGDPKGRDSFLLRVCFAPGAKGFTSEGSWASGFALIGADTVPTIDSIQLSGTGVAPALKSVTVDWGKRRIGLAYPDKAVISNEGDCAAVLSYLEEKGDIAIFSEDRKFPYTFAFPDEKSIDLSFAPADTLSYEKILGCTADWRLHGPVEIIMKGTGSLPVITTRDFVFDTTKVWSSRSSNADIFSTGGNERLSVDSLFWLDGDTASFEIDRSYLLANSFEPKSIYTIPVKFSPKRAGLHSARLLVANDALPAYARRNDTVVISGYANRDDILGSGVTVSASAVPACRFTPFWIDVENTSNTRAVLHSVAVNGTGGLIEIDAVKPGDTLEKGERRRFGGRVFIQAGETMKLDITVRLHSIFDESYASEKHFSFLVQSVSETISSEILLVKAAYPGDTVRVLLKGRIPKAIDTAITFGLRFRYDATFLHLVELPQKIFFNSLLQNRSHVVLTGKEGNEISIVTEEPVEVTDSLEWQTELKFLSLLSSKPNSKLSLQGEKNTCYSFEPAEKEISLREVCANSIRLIQNGNFFVITDFYPNPAGNEATIEFFLPESSAVTLEAVDVLGKKFSLIDNLYLTKGKHSRKLDLGAMPNGPYILILNNTTEQLQQLFIITK